MSAVTRDLIGKTRKFTTKTRGGKVEHFSGEVKEFSRKGEYVMVGHNWYDLNNIEVQPHKAKAAPVDQSQSQGSTESRPTGEQGPGPAHRLPASITEAAAGVPERESIS